MLVAKTIEITKSLQAGNGMPAADVDVNNGKIDVPVYELPPVVVTQDNAKGVICQRPRPSGTAEVRTVTKHNKAAEGLSFRRQTVEKPQFCLTQNWGFSTVCSHPSGWLLLFGAEGVEPIEMRQSGGQRIALVS